MNKDKMRISRGSIVKKGKFAILTQSHKSHPGDGTHGHGCRGGGKDLFFTKA